MTNNRRPVLQPKTILPKTYFIKTFGCQMNVSDSERIAGFLESLGLEPLFKNNTADLSAEALAKADIVIFNTCGVRKMAEDRAYGQIHNTRKNNPTAKIVLTGCLANRKDVQENLKDKVDLFCETKDVESIMYKVLGIKKIHNTSYLIHDTSASDCSYLKLTPKYSNHYQAYVPVMTGCNNFCSYCIVPYARGREVSRPAAEILTEIKNLIAAGTKEITLLGQNVNSYSSLHSSLYPGEMSRTRDRGVNFSQLLRKIDALPGVFWLRFMTPHPKDMTIELIETITSCQKVCEAVHLPLQAGDDKILEKMNRKYTRAHYLQLIEKIKAGFAKNKPGTIYALSSDIIVGFPGETKTQLEKTASVMRQVGFDMVFFGQFSPRPGTAAWQLKDNVTKAEKVRREKYLNEILARTARKNNQQYLGKTFLVLVSSEKMKVEPSESEGSTFITYFGTTRTLKNVKIKTDQKNLVGQFVKVKITRAATWNLEGTLA